MSSAGIGTVRAAFVADTKGFDVSVEGTGNQLRAAAQAANLAADQIVAAGEKIDRTAALQGRAAERARRAWEKELLVQQRSAQADMETARAKELAALKTDILSRSLEGQGRAQEFVNAATEHSVPAMAAASGAVRLLEGNFNNNIRAAERFLSTSLGLGPVLATMFPVVGAIALGAAVVRVGGELIDFGRHAQDLADRLGTNWLTGAIDQLTGVGKEIADLDALTLKWDQDIDTTISKMKSGALADIAQAQGPAVAGGFEVSGLQTRLSGNERMLTGLRELLTVQQRVGTIAGVGQGPIKPGEFERDQVIRDQARRAGVSTDPLIARAQSEQTKVKIEAFTRENEQLRQEITEKVTEASKQQGSSGDRVSREQDEKQRAAAERARAALRQQLDAAESQLRAIKALNDMSAQAEADFWLAKARAVGEGSGIYLQAMEHAHTAQAEALKQSVDAGNRDRFDFVKGALEGQAKQIEQAAPQSTGEAFTQMIANENKATAEQKRAALETFKSAEAKIQADERIQEVQIRLAVEQGRISQLQAAMALQAIHDVSATKWMGAYGTAQNDGAGMGGEEYQRHRATSTMQGLQDSAAVRAATGLYRVADATNLFAERLTDLPAHISQLFEQTLNSINDKIVASLNHEQGASLRDIGKQALKGTEKMGLEYIEGSLIKLVTGKDSHKPSGAQSDPLWVKMATAAGGKDGGGLLQQGSKALLGWLNDQDWAGKMFGGKLFGPGGIFDKGDSGGIGFGDNASGLGGLVGGIGGEIASMKMGLEYIEGSLMKALGFGGNKTPKGTASDPLFVQLATAGGIGKGGLLEQGGHALLGMLNDSDWAGKLFGGKLFGPGGIFDQQGSPTSAGSTASGLLGDLSGVAGNVVGGLTGDPGIGAAITSIGKSAAASASPLGTKSNPMYVKSADSGGGGDSSNPLMGLLSGLGSMGDMGAGAAAGAGDAMSSIGGSLMTSLAGFASGGPIPSNMPAIVGENGPEIFMPHSSGRIIPNDKAFGGGDTHIHVDARGSTDPAAVEASVHRAMRPYMRQMPQMAVAAVRDHNSRSTRAGRL